MFLVRIDNQDDRRITGFECGTRALFDQHYVDDPLWVFIDADKVRARLDMKDFLLHPTTFFVASNLTLKKIKVS